MTRYLADQKLEYHTYALPEERSLRVVIRGIPDGVEEQEIKGDLENQGLKIESVSRMTSRRTRQKMPLVLVKAPQDQQGLLKVNRCCALVVKIEVQKDAQVSSQCFRCQRFGHAQGRCTAQPKCVRCGGGHRAAECRKPRDTPAKCANCQGDHPASYRGCPSFPKLRKPASQAAPAQSRKPAPAPKAQPRAQPWSYANAAKRGPATKSEAALTAASLTTALEQMQRMYSAMSAFFAQMPNMPTA